ncbi:hypothetical protein OGATHE_004997 [Ogataea polymorpha]|uniref:Uncharacterized protein n=1 Tax=Ogataea polymorpha TaxID=460523 RepID=A0A9P8T099_9ASCO|nr:hypothetical protein OGATHE_004997 [Ogataea polymorpha]
MKFIQLSISCGKLAVMNMYIDLDISGDLSNASAFQISSLSSSVTPKFILLNTMALATSEKPSFSHCDAMSSHVSRPKDVCSKQDSTMWPILTSLPVLCSSSLASSIQTMCASAESTFSNASSRICLEFPSRAYSSHNKTLPGTNSVAFCIIRSAMVSSSSYFTTSIQSSLLRGRNSRAFFKIRFFDKLSVSKEAAQSHRRTDLALYRTASAMITLHTEASCLFISMFTSHASSDFGHFSQPCWISSRARLYFFASYSSRALAIHASGLYGFVSRILAKSVRVL